MIVFPVKYPINAIVARFKVLKSRKNCEIALEEK
jgi:hypothetical protein